MTPGQQLQTARVVAQGRDLVAAQAGDDMVLMHVIDGRFYSLTGTGRRIWELLEAPRAIDSLVDHLTDEFDVARDRCAAEVIDLCRALIAKGLMDVVA